MASFFTRKQRDCTNYYIVFLFVCFTEYHSSSAKNVPPALYVFGDSLVDNGNNNYLPFSILKANFPYNGIDYPEAKSTGRYSNGKNAADFIAEKLGFTSPPPYMSMPDNDFLKGVNFASGGATVLYDGDEEILKQSIPLSQQVEHFSTVRQKLIKQMGVSAAEKRLSASIFSVVIGSNDIIQMTSNSIFEDKNSPQPNIPLILSTLKYTIMALHGLGARKLLFIGVPPIGCAPRQRFKINTNKCNFEVNHWSRQYNNGVEQTLSQLKSELNGFQYTFFDTYKFFIQLIQNPLAYGLKEIESACCGIGDLRAEFPCTPVSQYCGNRNEYAFWDFYHPTEAVSRIVVDGLFAGFNEYSQPISINQLMTIE